MWCMSAKYVCQVLERPHYLVPTGKFGRPSVFAGFSYLQIVRKEDLTSLFENNLYKSEMHLLC